MGLSAPRVIVVGAGPAGLVAAIQLARYGIRTLVLERRSERSTLPRATGITTRTMEILRSWGLEDEVRAGANEVSFRGWASRTLGSPDGEEMVLGYPDPDEAARYSPTAPAWVAQDHVEPVLARYLEGLGAAEVRTGAELVGLGQDRGGVDALVRDRATGHAERVRAEYAIGADGIRSAVRELAGIRFEGEPELEEADVVMFRAPLDEVVGERRYGINAILHPGATGVMLPLGRGDRWGFGRRTELPGPRLTSLSHGELRELIATATGLPGIEPRIEHLGATTFGAQLAERYRERRVFLAGDAAHRVTPRGGTGMNLAIHDAFDLGWKLAWVLRGWAAPALLDSYEAERRPVGAAGVARTARPDGSEREVDDAVRDDLGGRVAHASLEAGGRRASTIDLIAPGLTLLAAPGADATRVASAAPLSVRRLDPAIAAALGLGSRDAILLRPDGKEAGAECR